MTHKATDSAQTSSCSTKQKASPDMVEKPSHYQIVPGIEAMDVIDAVLTRLELSPYQSYLLGNLLKYRLRAGKKFDLEQDIKKATEYERRLEAARRADRHGIDVTAQLNVLHNAINHAPFK